MARGSPGGILMIGAGVFLISLGFTGKFAEVWNVITNKVPSLPDGLPPQPKPKDAVPEDEGNTPPSEGGTCGAGQQQINIRSTNENKCIFAQDIAAPEGDGCRNGYLEGIRLADGLKVCVRTVRGAGAAYAYTEMPTGVIGLRLQPNVR